MKSKNKNDLTKLALAAFVLSAALPFSGYADDDAEFEQMEQTEQACGARVRPVAATGRGSPMPVTRPESVKIQGRGPTGPTGARL